MEKQLKKYNINKNIKNSISSDFLFHRSFNSNRLLLRLLLVGVAALTRYQALSLHEKKYSHFFYGAHTTENIQNSLLFREFFHFALDRIIIYACILMLLLLLQQL